MTGNGGHTPSKRQHRLPLSVTHFPEEKREIAVVSQRPGLVTRVQTRIG